MLWKKLAENTHEDMLRSVQMVPSLLAVDPEVHFLMMPIQKSSPPSPYDKDHKDKAGKGKGNKGKKSKGSGGPPEGCHQETPQDKPICFGYNRGFCKLASAGKRCKRGFHVCWKCFKAQPDTTCQH